MSISNTGSNALAYIFTLIKNKYVAKVFKSGSNSVYKTLSDNDLTDALKAQYDAAYSHSQATHAPAGAQANVIETVKVNGTALTPDNKAVDIPVPTVPTISTDISADASSDAKTASPKAVKSFVEGKGYLTEHQSLSGYATEQYVSQAISGITGFSFQILGSGEYDSSGVPTVTGASNKIYLVPLSTSATNNVYAEWIYVSNGFEKIGETSVDLSGYVRENDIVELTNAQIQTIWDNVLSA